MSKVIKIILILCIISCFFMNVCIATEGEDTTGSENSSITTQVKSVNPISELPEANLGLNNVLNVILIAIGVLLILFAIAILIRLKK